MADKGFAPPFLRDPGWALALPFSIYGFQRDSGGCYSKPQEVGGAWRSTSRRCFRPGLQVIHITPYTVSMEKTSPVATNVVGLPQNPLLCRKGGTRVGEWLAVTATEKRNHRKETASRRWLRGFFWDLSDNMQWKEYIWRHFLQCAS